MSNPLHELFIQAEQPDNHNSLMTILGSLTSRYEFICKLHQEETRTFSKYKDLTTGREVVLVSLTTEEEKDVQKFIEEMKISSSLQHPAIVPLYDAGKNEDGLFFARKWIDDKSLQQRLEDSKKVWNKDQVLRIYLQLCEAIHYAHSQGVTHGNLKAEKVFISDSCSLAVTDWSKAVHEDNKLIKKDICSLSKMLIPIMELCLDFETIPRGLKAIGKKGSRINGGYANVKQLIDDLQAYREGYVPKAEKAFLLKSACQFFKRNPLFCVVLLSSVILITYLSIWFFKNLNEKQEIIDTNLQEAEVKKAEAAEALKEFQKENDLRNEIALEAAEAYAAVARNALRIGDVDKAREMESMALQLSKNERFTKEVQAHLAFIDQKYEIAEKIFSSENKPYFGIILELCKKYKQTPPDIAALLKDYEFTDRKELTIYSVNRLLFRKSGEDFKKSFRDVVAFFNPNAEINLKVKIFEGHLTVDLSGSRRITSLKFMQGMPLTILDIRNTGISDVDLQETPQLQKVYFNKGQKLKTLKSVERISQ